MTQIDSIDEILKRCRAIGATVADLAHASGVHRGTIYRCIRNPDEMTTKTGRQLMAGLLSRERQVLKHLQEIHSEKQKMGLG